MAKSQSLLKPRVDGCEPIGGGLGQLSRFLGGTTRRGDLREHARAVPLLQGIAELLRQLHSLVGHAGGLVGVPEVKMRLCSPAKQLRKVVTAPDAVHQTLSSAEQLKCRARAPTLEFERTLVAV